MIVGTMFLFDKFINKKLFRLFEQHHPLLGVVVNHKVQLNPCLCIP